MQPLTDEEIDEIVIAQVDDDDAWEEEIEVTPLSRSRAVGDAGAAATHPATRRHSG